MDYFKKRLFILIIVLSAIIGTIASIIVAYPKIFQGKNLANPWETPTATFTIASPAQPALTISPAVRSTSRQDVANKCVHSAEYWLKHPELLSEQYHVGLFRYTKQELIAAFNTSTMDAFDYLFIQLNAAYINYSNFGSLSGQVGITILHAAGWLASHSSGSELSQTDQETAISLGKTLADYNNGSLGLTLCAGEATSAPFMGATASVVATTPSATFTRTVRWRTQIPSATPKPPGLPTETATRTNTATATRTATASRTATSTNTATRTPTATRTATYTGTATFTATATRTATSTRTDTATATFTETFTPSPTASPTDTDTPTATDTLTATVEPTETDTPTFTDTATDIPPTPTETPSPLPSDTPTPPTDEPTEESGSSRQ